MKTMKTENAIKLTTGNRYDIESLTFADWTKGDGSGHEGYNVADYFDAGGTYLGPDECGIEPMFEATSTNTDPA